MGSSELASEKRSRKWHLVSLSSSVWPHFNVCWLEKYRLLTAPPMASSPMIATVPNSLFVMATTLTARIARPDWYSIPPLSHAIGQSMFQNVTSIPRLPASNHKTDCSSDGTFSAEDDCTK